MPRFQVKCVQANVYFDDQSGDESGWYALYTDRDGVVLDDSQKVWHPMMPRRRDAVRSAERIARRYARGLARKC